MSNQFVSSICKSDRPKAQLRRALWATGAIVTAASLTLAAAPSQAHISIYPTLSATGVGTTALTNGQSGYLNFRVGHGCVDDTHTLNPSTGLDMNGSSWGTHAFSVTVPEAAQGLGYGIGTKPKPGYKPGWSTKIVANDTDRTYTITWTAKDSSFAIPAYDDNNVNAVFADFSLSLKWATTALIPDLVGSRVYFPAEQVCVVDMTNKPTMKSLSKVSVTKIGTKARVNITVPARYRSKTLDLAVNGVSVGTVRVAANKNGQTVLAGSAASAALVKGALVEAKYQGVRVGYVGGQVASRKLTIAWDQAYAGATASYTDGGAVEHNQAPSVVVQ